VLAAAFSSAGMQAQQPATPSATQQTTPAAQPAAGQLSEQEPDVGAPTITINANEVNLIFTVTDRHGRYNPNLRQSDFALLDDQKAPASIKSFHQQINLPMRVGIVIDASTSIRTRFQFEQQ
jgi:hypothetical protein